MDVQVKAGSLVRAITESAVSQAMKGIADDLTNAIAEAVSQFLSDGVSTTSMYALENRLGTEVRRCANSVLQWLVSQLEPDLDQMPGTVEHNGQNYRRLADKTSRSRIVTPFGELTIDRARYRRGRDGKTIFPIELLLGIENGFTPAAADIVGKQFATSGSTQGRTREMIQDRFGLSIGNEKLRKLTANLAASLGSLRQEAQVAKLLELVNEVRKRDRTPVLSVSRDGVSLGLAPWSFFEMAGVACISVIDQGKKLGTVYLGRAPESNQDTLSNELTSLLAETLRACGEDLPDVVYVTDAGKIETAYWKNVLRKFFVDGRRIKVTRVVDYYHASERLTTIADALQVDKSERADWLSRARGLLLKPGGHGRLLRSIAKMRELHGYKKTFVSDAEKAERYLRRYKRFMDFASARERGYPIGSGVVESACKQIVSERMKLSGMRWHREGGQHIMTLRCILLSKIWNNVYEKWLQAKPTVADLMPSGNR